MAERDFNKEFKTGVVESVDDPTYAGRVKVRIKGLHDNIETDQLPWCTYGGSLVFSGSGGGNLSIPRVGTNVRVRFKDNDINSMEWYGTNRVDKELSQHISGDYQGSHTLLWDTESDLRIVFTPTTTGLEIYYKESKIVIAPDNTITIHYGNEGSGTQIQLSNGKVDIQAKQDINLTANNINMTADNINILANKTTKIQGKSGTDCATNANALSLILGMMAKAIDAKTPSTGGLCEATVKGLEETIKNRGIIYSE